MTTMTARPATPDDAEEISGIVDLLSMVSQNHGWLRYEATEDAIRDSLNRPNHRWIVAVDDGRIMGWTFAVTAGPRLAVKSVRGLGLLDDTGVPTLRHLWQHRGEASDMLIMTDETTGYWFSTVEHLIAD